MTISRTGVLAAGTDRLIDIATGYMAAKQLFAAQHVGLFPALADGPASVSELAAKLGLSERATRIIADSMNALGLLDRADGRYRNAEIAETYLAGRDSAIDLGAFFAFLDAVSYGHWRQFNTTVQTGEPGVLDLDGVEPGLIGRGIGAYQSLHASMFPRFFDVRPYRRLLDLGGQTPRFAIAAMLENPSLTTTFVYDPPETEALTKATEDAGLAGRSRIEPAPTLTARPSGPYDLVLINHCIHRFQAEENRAILRAARDAASDDARLLIVDFFLDSDPRQRLIDALHAGEYLVIDGTVAYPQEDVRDWLLAAGWRPTDTIALPGSPRVMVAEAAERSTP